jgi:hypothetical protein
MNYTHGTDEKTIVCQISFTGKLSSNLTTSSNLKSTSRTPYRLPFLSLRGSAVVIISSPVYSEKNKSD